MRMLNLVAGKLSSLSAILGGAIMLLMMLQVSADVLMKHFLNWPIPATLETVSGYYMVALVYLPLGAVTRDHQHLEVELFTQGLPPRRLAVFKLFGCLVGAAYVALLCWRGAEEALHMTRIGEVWETATWNMQVWPSRWFFPVGCALMLVHLVILALDNLAFIARGERLVPAGPDAAHTGEAGSRGTARGADTDTHPD